MFYKDISKLNSFQYKKSHPNNNNKKNNNTCSSLVWPSPETKMALLCFSLAKVFFHHFFHTWNTPSFASSTSLSVNAVHSADLSNASSVASRLGSR